MSFEVISIILGVILSASTRPTNNGFREGISKDGLILTHPESSSSWSTPPFFGTKYGAHGSTYILGGYNFEAANSTLIGDKTSEEDSSESSEEGCVGKEQEKKKGKRFPENGESDTSSEGDTSDDEESQTKHGKNAIMYRTNKQNIWK